MSGMLKRIWLVSPMAFARVGGSSTPLQNYQVELA
jgi:hypothetical protein